jgi:DNA-binding CsgD family transcriptional regulator
MSEPTSKKRPFIWRIPTSLVKNLDFGRQMPAKFQESFQHISLPIAIRGLRRGVRPYSVFIEGPPGREAQTILAELKAIDPTLPVFVVTSWDSEGEMRSWISRLVVEAVRPAKPATFDQLNNSYGLSKRELQTLRFIVQGLIKKEIAEQLAISYHTVNNHECSIFRKLKVHTRSAAVAKALMEHIC